MAGVDSGIVVSVFFDTGFVSILCDVFAGVVKSRLVYAGLMFWIVDSSARINRHMIGMFFNYIILVLTFCVKFCIGRLCSIVVRFIVTIYFFMFAIFFALSGFVVAIITLLL